MNSVGYQEKNLYKWQNSVHVKSLFSKLSVHQLCIVLDHEIIGDVFFSYFLVYLVIDSFVYVV